MTYWYFIQKILYKTENHLFLLSQTNYNKFYIYFIYTFYDIQYSEWKADYGIWDRRLKVKNLITTYTVILIIIINGYVYIWRIIFYIIYYFILFAFFVGMGTNIFDDIRYVTYLLLFEQSIIFFSLIDSNMYRTKRFVFHKCDLLSERFLEHKHSEIVSRRKDADKSLFSVFHAFRVNVTVLKLWKNAAVGLRATGAQCISVRIFSTHRWSSRTTRPSANNFGICIGTYLSVAILDMRIFEASKPSLSFPVFSAPFCNDRSNFCSFAKHRNILALIQNTSEKIGKFAPFVHSADTIFFIYWNDVVITSYILRKYRCQGKKLVWFLK